MVAQDDVAREPEAAPLLHAHPADPPAAAAAPPASRVLPHLLVSVLLFVTAIALTIPVRPRLILDAADGNTQRASVFSGFVDCLVAFFSIFSSPLFGAVSDITGRKPILVMSHFGELIGLLVVARFPKNLAIQFPAYMFIALTNAYVTTANTIIADISAYEPGLADDDTPVSAATNYGYLGVAIGFSFLIGPVLGGTIEDTFYLASSFHVASLMILAAVVYVCVFLPETKPCAAVEDPLHTHPASHPSTAQFLNATFVNVSASALKVTDAIRATDFNPLPRVRRIFSANPALTWIAISLSMTSIAQGGLNAIMFLYVNERLGWGTKETGLFLSGVGLSLLISQGILAPLFVRFLGEVTTIIFGFSMSALHYLVYSRATSTSIMIIAMFFGMLSFVSDPAMKGLLARQVSIDSQGSLQGSLSALTAVVRPISPIFSAALFSYGISIGRPGLVFEFITIISASAVLCARIAFWKPGLK
ncbi:unnamed protein product [Chondrus crispus]|uniref:Major facilitator superfamily (MFS) profile domain-containing protein n=1 Tax=Chondrus crispus TaxID=2769 RepID=R7QH96_CHOCR|nr:unnamed protein product [Chondrus crispus]CDF36800.1 unnamed protein product [Chondrus crispus]|eukprot:XP_005716619.1 unnamed protein product [Chondrus crispus]